jgi:YVTN family beta-propeller protein
MRRVVPWLLLFLFASLAPARAAGPPPAGLAFVINSAQASISLIDVGTYREIRRIPVLREPHHMALTPDHRFLLVGDTTGNQVLYLDPETGRVRRRVAIVDPYQLVFSPDGRWLTIAGLARNQVDVYTVRDDDTLQLVRRFPMRTMPSHINYAPDSSVVYISLQQTGRVAAIDITSLSVLWDARVGDTPAGVLWHDGVVLVGLMGEDCVAVVDPVDGHVERCIRTGQGAHVLFVPPSGSPIYVTNRVAGTIVSLDPQSLAVTTRWRIGGGPDDLDFGPDGLIWVSRRFAHSVAVIDPATGDVLHTIEVGRSPHGIWLNTHDRFPAPFSLSAR